MSFNAGDISATLTLDRSPFQRGLDEAKAEAQRFADGSYAAKLDADNRPAQDRIAETRSSVERLSALSSTIELRADNAAALAKVDETRAAVDRLATESTSIEVRVDNTDADARLESTRVAAERLATESASITVRVDNTDALAQLEATRLAVERIAAASASITIRVDAALAEAKLAGFEARLAAIGDKQVTVHVDTSQLDQATQAAEATGQALADVGDGADSAGGGLNLMFAAVAAGFPPASAAVLDLSGAIALAAIPIAAIQVGMNGIGAAAAPLAGQFLTLQSIVSATFEQGLKPAVSDIAGLMPTLTSGLVGTASALTTVAQQVAAVAGSRAGLADLQATFSNVESIVAGMAPGVAGLVQNFLDLASIGTGAMSGLSSIVNGLSTQWHNLIAGLTSTGVAQGAISSLVDSLGAVLALLPPLVSQGVQLMDVLGPPLAGALQLVGGALNLLSGPFGAVTSSALSMLAAWKLLSAAMNSNLFTGLVSSLARAETSVRLYTTSVQANASAQNAADAAAEAHTAAVTAATAASERAAAAQAVYDRAVAAGTATQAEATAATLARNEALVAAAAAAEAAATADAAAATAAETAAGGDTIYAQAAGRTAAANAAAAAGSDSAAAAAARNAAAAEAAAGAAAGQAGAADAASVALSAEAVAAAEAAVAAEANAAAVAAAAAELAAGAVAAGELAAALSTEAEAASITASTAAQAATVIATLTGANSEAAATAAATAAALETEAAAAGTAAAAAEADAAALTAMAGSSERAAAAAAVTATSMRAQAGAAAAASAESGAAAAATGGFAGAVGKLGAALPIIGIAVIGAYTAIKSFTTSTDDAVKAMQLGGQASADMATKVASQTSVANDANSAIGNWAAGINNWISANVFGIATTDSVTEAYQKAQDAMTPLQLAQEHATQAQGDYNQAVKQFTATSPQAEAAQRRYAEATLAVAQAQSAAVVSQTNVDAALAGAAAHFGDAAQAADGAAQSTVSYANAVATLADPMASAGDKMKAFAADVAGAADAPRTLLSAMDAVDKSMTSFADSTIKITPALVDASGAINTTTKAGQELATGILGTAKAYDNLRGATIASAQAQGDNMVTALAKGDVALETTRQRLIEVAVQHGATRAQAQAMVDTYLAIPPSVKTEFQQPGMVKALADALGLTKNITSIPNDKTIIVSSLSDDAKRKLEDLGLTVKTLPNGKIVVTADATSAQVEIDKALAAAHHEVFVPVGADDSVYRAKLAQGRELAASSKATMPIDGNPGLFNGKVIAGVAQANGSKGTITIDGNPTLANGKTTASVTFANGSRGTITIDGNQTPANGKINASVTYANGSRGTIQVDAATAAANAAINYAARDRYATIHLTVQQTNVAAGGKAQVGGLATGGILRPMADGGIVGMADGGGLALNPLQGGIAQVVPPNTWRIIGDNLRVSESYIPQDGSTRSQAVLAATADAMGWGLIPKQIADALRHHRGGSDGAAAPDLSPLRTSLANLRTVAPGGGEGVRDAVQRVAARLEALEERLVTSRSVTIANTYFTESSVSQADATVKAQRRQAALGLFD